MPVRAVLVDHNGVQKVLNSEYVHFDIQGPGEIIGDASTFANPMKTEFGVATALIRATTEAGEIRITAYSKGLEPDEIVIRSVEPALSFMNGSFAVETRGVQSPVSMPAADRMTNLDPNMPNETKVLKDEIARLKLELISKEQDIMELRSKLGR